MTVAYDFDELSPRGKDCRATKAEVPEVAVVQLWLRRGPPSRYNFFLVNRLIELDRIRHQQRTVQSETQGEFGQQCQAFAQLQLRSIFVKKSNIQSIVNECGQICGLQIRICLN